MKYISVKEASKRWNVSERNVRNYCTNGKINGSYFDGNHWLIPDDAIKPGKKENGGHLNLVQETLTFINESPINLFAINNVKKILENKGYKKHILTNKCSIGDKLFLTINGTSLLAINIGKNISKEYAPLHITASHCDSPCFKIKPIGENKVEIYNKINLELYGSAILPSWLDRPLSIAGRVSYKNKENITTKLINFDEDLLIIPNLCVHFNRNINNGHEYNIASDMQAFIGQEMESVLPNLISTKLKINYADVLNYDLYVYNHEKGIIWGTNKEFISSPRLDDLECVYLSLKAFIESENDDAINILYISDNEEVGSSSRQGADSEFFKNSIESILMALGFNSNEINKSLMDSFLVSMDNGHAVHPNFSSITDKDNKCFMNKGVVIKSNASQTYTTDGVSSSIFQRICESSKAKYQFFTNRSDIRGGSTLGSILLTHIPVMSVDVGLPQLAMHSCYETAGAKDISDMYNAIKTFYKSNIKIDEENIELTIKK